MTTAPSQTELPYHHLQLDSNTTPTQIEVDKDENNKTKSAT
jgi:hypothetical protein